MSEEKEKEKTDSGCGCLMDVIALFLLIIILDLLGCSWCSGFTEKVKGIFKSDSQTRQIHPGDLR